MMYCDRLVCYSTVVSLDDCDGLLHWDISEVGPHHISISAKIISLLNVCKKWQCNFAQFQNVIYLSVGNYWLRDLSPFASSFLETLKFARHPVSLWDPSSVCCGLVFQ